MKLYFTILFLAACYTTALCQQKTLGKFIITSAKINNVDVTESYLENEGFIAFYTNDNNSLSMTNIMSKKANSQSYGRLYAMTQKVTKETEEQYETNLFLFKWRYKNTYDAKSGTASVRFQKVYKPEGVTFICTIIPENLQAIVLKGYMEGSIDLSDYQN
ncbi:hypothetical protein [Dyadobacter sp. 3J3]|uniref:hypothetical protein n=1 Tax=Dyadobacter sp. 3J3 TaxID=2606600 RepID=UPI00135AEE82|nr:hypothetical protein [Dyadobacter sp. 3J3]